MSDMPPTHTTSQADLTNGHKPLRLWPGVAAAVLLGLIRFGIPIFFPDSGIFAFLGSLILALIILAWWIFFSRAPWSERLGAVFLMAIALYATSRIVHESFRLTPVSSPGKL